MKKVPLLALLTFAVATSAKAQSTFQANFELHRPSLNGAVIAGVLTYDGPNNQMLLEYTNPGAYREIQKFNPNFGRQDVNSLTTAQKPVATDSQWDYRIGDACQGCSATPIDYAMPIYANDPTVYQISGGPDIVVDGATCHEYAPLDSVLTPLTHIWFTSAGILCRALWTDGSDYTFTSLASVDLTGTTIYDENNTCSGCAQQLDLFILIDRSGSISSSDYDDARAAAGNLTRGFTLSPSQTHVAIGQFDVDVQLVMDFYEGTSYGNVDAALAFMDCACSDTLDYSLQPQEAPSSATVCCGRRTSISKALHRASQYLTANGRTGAREAIVLVTDGRDNTLIDGVTPCVGAACDSDLTQAIAGVVADHPGIEIYGVGMGNTDRRKMALFKGGQFVNLTGNGSKQSACTLADTCAAATCAGLCECSQCVAPTP